MSSLDLTESLNWQQLTDEAVRHLQALLRCDTTNPPGNEILAARYMQEQLATEQIETRILESAPGRANLWARLPGNGTKRPLLLLSHVDVVPTEAQHWSTNPFSGEIRDGYIYGRGAVDMKDMTAKELTLILQLAREVRAGRELTRDIILLAVADEECHGTYGMRWLVENHPELIDAEYALNEGGGFALNFGGQRFYVCETAQKGSVCVTLHAKGDPGHGSIPHRNNAIVHLAHALDRLAQAPLPLHVIPTTRTLITHLARAQKQPVRFLLPQMLNPLFSNSIFALIPDKNIANALSAMLHNTASPTLLEAGTALNVIPSEARATLDGRIIPGQTAESFRAEIVRRIADPQVDVEVEFESGGHESSAETELFSALNAAIATHDPDAHLLPFLLPAVTDSRFIVPRGIIAYGFDPMSPEPGWPAPQQMAHGHDERISLANMGFGLRVLYDAVTQICR